MIKKISSLYRTYSTDMSDLCLAVATASGIAGILLPAISGFQSGWASGGAMLGIGAFYFALGIVNLRKKTATPKIYDSRYRQVQFGSGTSSHHYDVANSMIESEAEYSKQSETERSSSKAVEA